MKKSLLGGTALVGGAVLAGAVAMAAEAPQWKLSGNANFQFYWVDQDRPAVGGVAGATILGGFVTPGSTWLTTDWVTFTTCVTIFFCTTPPRILTHRYYGSYVQFCHNAFR
ncbi:MAG: hypothetical protein IMF08_10170 [Proteobacteria bacterium]|nr:hypothetical protein [Pseudomonadota bacterium]